MIDDAPFAPAPSATFEWRKPLLLLAAAATLGFGLPAGAALMIGVVLAVTVGNPWAKETAAIAPRLLQGSVVALGAGMDLGVVARVGAEGLGYTAAGIALALAFGAWIGRRLGVPRDASLLLSVGTAICGGSAIAAVAPAIGAKPRDVSTAIVSVFLLNAVALFVFPFVGHQLHLTERAFGLWCALAIHDTSSVVGAAGTYGQEALQIATAAKLARALWIVPVTIGVVAIRASQDRDAGRAGPQKKPAKRPWFIAGFVIAAAIVTFVPVLRPAGHLVALAAHRALSLTLLAIGLGLSRTHLREVGLRPMVQAIALWIVLASVSLAAIVMHLVA